MVMEAYAGVPASLADVALRELRQARVMSQRELARLAGVSTKTLNGIEQFKVRPHPTTLRKIAAALGVQPSALAEHLERRERQRPMPRLFPDEPA